MRRSQFQQMAPMVFVALALAWASTVFGQTTHSLAQQPTNAPMVSAGQKMEIEGIISAQTPNSLAMRSSGGGIYNVTLAGNTEVKEKKSNPFRGAKRYSAVDLVPGLHVEIKGTGDSAGAIVAREIRLTQDDFKVAQTMDVRVVPVENRLAETQNRLGETEQNVRHLSIQVQELSAISNAARGSAKSAQETADTAISVATDARSGADKAKAGVQAAHERIHALDDYAVKNMAAVHFRAGSALLSLENKNELGKIAGMIKGEKGYLIEVSGFASADGDESFNRRLSQKRADAVIQHMAENHSIPLHRFVTPMGLGESQPVAANTTREGRKENRRVEVRILVNKGLRSAADSPELLLSSQQP